MPTSARQMPTPFLLVCFASSPALIRLRGGETISPCTAALSRISYITASRKSCLVRGSMLAKYTPATADRRNLTRDGLPAWVIPPPCSSLFTTGSTAQDLAAPRSMAPGHPNPPPPRAICVPQIRTRATLVSAPRRQCLQRPAHPRLLGDAGSSIAATQRRGDERCRVVSGTCASCVSARPPRLQPSNVPGEPDPHRRLTRRSPQSHDTPRLVSVRFQNTRDPNPGYVDEARAGEAIFAREQPLITNPLPPPREPSHGQTSTYLSSPRPCHHASAQAPFSFPAPSHTPPIAPPSLPSKPARERPQRPGHEIVQVRARANSAAVPTGGTAGPWPGGPRTLNVEAVLTLLSLFSELRHTAC